MGRKRTSSGMDALIGMPWPIGVLVGILLFSGVRYAIPWWFSRKDGGLAHGIASSFWQALSPFAWLLLAMCWMAALLSFLGARRRRILLETCTTLESLAAPGWRQFEQLVGEAFRRQGYVVEETGLGGADGGIDLVLRKDTQRVLVQCKQWRRRQVGVSVVREMAGLLAHHRADGVKIVCVGTFTRDAEAFARGKAIELIDGVTLLEMVHAAKEVRRSAQAPCSPVEPGLPGQQLELGSFKACPRCGSTLVQRKNRRTGEHFLGCSQFPRCRGSGEQA
ncbi:restriction endonuclease [Stenotrophomonas sp. SORGH_AS_0282]|uniref:restriction endonuclease n=1 Tax=Stenotrophomonas TaxID=40323 RepID=UPI00277FEC67|nr:restriction endonuclease [Stenotrophomonas sp. SORGH_AS_0282]MDQ1062666.1 restriction system protein [Stenotrophomonas sp. SORGH_AS_0282]MDQ1188979.1 restriction system protein [Stenotrophomonas sp. SORGH_AS_0282]